ncbi:hypothetical protein QBC45DRAFT_339240 [Copromyces sp. CBS 386.78]|nr:hypothetical protein QBC45DRAFT_339240 [Copromyces sp. CBS 386.78]
MSLAKRALVQERLVRGEFTCTGRFCGVMAAPNTVCGNCRQRSRNYRRSRQG